MTLLIGTRAHPVLESFYQAACRAKTNNGGQGQSRGLNSSGGIKILLRARHALSGKRHDVRVMVLLTTLDEPTACIDGPPLPCPWLLPLLPGDVAGAEALRKQFLSGMLRLTQQQARHGAGRGAAAAAPAGRKGAKKAARK